MILDQLTLLSNAQAITADAGSTNCLDLGAPGIIPYGLIQMKRNIGKGGCDVPLLIQVVEDFATCTSLEVLVQSDDNDAFSSPKDLISHTVAVAELKKGFKFAIDKIPRGTKERYVRIYFNVIGANATAGKITAGVVGSVDGSYKG